jgi:hypothetical protein
MASIWLHWLTASQCSFQTFSRVVKDIAILLYVKGQNKYKHLSVFAAQTISCHNTLMLSNHTHTGRLLPHHHTSYAGLTFVLMLTAIFMAAFSVPSQADSKIISARVDGPAPTQGAIIYAPANNHVFTESQIQVSGHCPDNTYIKLSRNSLLAGSALCQASNSFSLQITLVPGSNTLLAQNYDALDQPGPATPIITVFYQPKPSASESITTTPIVKTPYSSDGINSSPKVISAPPLLITTETPLSKGLLPEKLSTWHITISGGQKPYALRWNWGDGTTNIYSLPESGAFTPSHSYKRPGRYTLNIEATDTAGSRAILQLAATVDGPVAPISSGRSERKLHIAWPLWAIAAFMVISFWLGDKYKKLRTHPTNPNAQAY